MTPLEKRGERLFLGLAAVLILGQVIGLGFAFFGGFRISTLVQQIALIALSILAWKGDKVARVLLPATCLFKGGFLAISSIGAIASIGIFARATIGNPVMHALGLPMAFVAPVAGFYVAAGLMFLFSPSIRAFLRYQSGGSFDADALDDDDYDDDRTRPAKKQPRSTKQFVGRLPLRSGTLLIGDPSYTPGLEVPNIKAEIVQITALPRRYPSGAQLLTALKLEFGNPVGPEEAALLERRKIGTIAIDSAKLVIVDKQDFKEHWTEVGKDRIGVIGTGRNQTVLRLISKRFKLQTVQRNAVRAEVVGPVFEPLEKEIEDYLKTFPEYEENTFIYFHVQTNNSFERANYFDQLWGFIPVGNMPSPRMFVGVTGHGDGTYNVYCEFAGDTPRVLTVSFIDDEATQRDELGARS